MVPSRGNFAYFPSLSLRIPQLSRLHALEGHHDEVKQELEKNIQSLRAQIGKYDADYNKNLEVLGGLTDSLMNLLKNVRTALLPEISPNLVWSSRMPCTNISANFPICLQ
jgi:hypothetical protein